jgi:hypothetical protein
MIAENFRNLEQVERSGLVLDQWEWTIVNSFVGAELDWVSFGQFEVAVLQELMDLAALDEKLLSPSMLADLQGWPSAYEEGGAS